jgi:hypothetical protein
MQRNPLFALNELYEMVLRSNCAYGASALCLEIGAALSDLPQYAEWSKELLPVFTEVEPTH